jgi:hypothetical protein
VSYIEKGYLVTVKSLESRLLLIDYFTHYPLLSSKRLDYLNWVKAHEIVKNKQYRLLEGTEKLESLKLSMNSNRTNYN